MYKMLLHETTTLLKTTARIENSKVPISTRGTQVKIA